MTGTSHPKNTIRVILSGGGTGGHIYPAVSVAESLQKRFGDRVQLLFVGATGKMEMEKIPALGYRIVGLPVVGLQRRLTWRNLSVPFKLFYSLHQSKRILRDFRPDVVIGFGGYASGPILKQAQRCGIPTVLWEGNSYAGMANRMLARNAHAICVAHSDMERFFPKDKIRLTGNPLRGHYTGIQKKNTDAFAHFGFDRERPTLLVTGGSLGTRTLNESVSNYLDQIVSEAKINLIWQTGAYYYDQLHSQLKDKKMTNVWYGPFIDPMSHAYSLADLAVSRAGAGTISELSLVGMPVIFVPSPNVAEDHQTKNALALVNKDAALLVKDSEAPEKVIPLALETLENTDLLQTLSSNITQLALPDAARHIADILCELAGASGDEPVHGQQQLR